MYSPCTNYAKYFCVLFIVLMKVLLSIREFLIPEYPAPLSTLIGGLHAFLQILLRSITIAQLLLSMQIH
jgi:hypothetical protein